MNTRLKPNYLNSVRVKLLLIPGVVIVGLIISAIALNNFIDRQKASIEGGVYPNLKQTHEVSSLYNQVIENHILIVDLLRQAENKEINEEEIYEKGKVIIANLYEQREKITPISAHHSLASSTLDDFIEFSKLHKSYMSEASSAITMTTVEPELAHHFLAKANNNYLKLGTAYIKFLSSSEESSLADLNKSIIESNQLLDRLQIFSIPFIAILIFISLSLGRNIFFEINKRDKYQKQKLETSKELAAAHLERANALDAANTATHFFMARMSHELRTPLNAIIGFSSILKKKIDKKAFGKYHEIPERINEAGKHLLALINDILDIEEVQQGKLTFDLEPCNLEVVIDECINLCKEIAEKSGIKLVAQNLQFSVYTDKVRLMQIIINLISNAIKYGQPNGYVIIFVSKEREGIVSLNIMDDGVGIPAEEQEKLFQPFSRLDYAKRSNIEGRGIGLTLTKHLIEGMQGSIGVQSLENSGSRFYISFPVPPNLSAKNSSNAS